MQTESTKPEIQFSSIAQSYLTLCNSMDCSKPGLNVHHQFPEFTQIYVHWRWCHPNISSSVVPFSACLQSFPQSGAFLMRQLFASGGQSFSISPSNEYSGLISFRMDWLDLFAVQGTFKSLLQHHTSKASILQHSAFFTVQLSHPYMTTGKTIALTRQTFVDKVMPLLFNMPSRLVITFLPRSRRLFISRLQSQSAVILETRKIKSVTDSTVSSSICHEVMGPDARILVFWMLSFKPTFSLSSFTFNKSWKCFAFCHKCGVICISEVTDIPPNNLDSSLWFIQSRISHDVLCI